MKSIIKQIYTGDLPAFDSIIPKSKTYRVTQDKIVSILDTLEQHLPVPEQKQLETLDELYWDIAAETAYTSFDCGFRLAFALAFELFLDR